MRKLHQCGGILLCLLLLVSLLPHSAAAKEGAKPEVVRVGWYEDSYHITGTNGERSGYGYEYEQAIASYTGWDYEYIQGGWSELLEMLQNGEIDLMAAVSYTDERAESMLFSELPMGEERFYLYADLNNTDISPSDLSTLNGKRIAVLSGSVHEALFTEWEEKTDIHTIHVPITGLDEGKQKLDAHAIDGMISTEAPVMVDLGLSAVVMTGGSSSYYAVNKNRPDLKEELDTAMRQIASDDPFYADELYQRYLSAQSVAVLTGEERTWLDQHGAIRVGYWRKDSGVSAIDPNTGELVGALNDYVTYAGDCLSNYALDFELVGFDSQQDELKALQNGEIDMIFHASQNACAAEQNDLALTNTAWTVNLAAITTKGFVDEEVENRVAVPSDDLALAWYISYNYPKWDIVPCETQGDAEKAVRRGEADCLVISSSQVTRYLKDNKLHSMFLMQPDNASFAVRRGNAMLLSVLNKTLKTMPSSMLTGAIALYDNSVERVTVTDFVKDNLLAVSLALAAVFALILALVLGLLWKAKQAAAQERDLNQKLQESQEHLQVALAQAESANSAKTIFLNNVSHDIRTPMNAIVGLTKLMEHDQGDQEKLDTYIHKVQRSSQHLLSLINDVLDMSKIESSEVSLTKEPISLADQMEQVDSIMRPQAEEHGQSLVLQVHHVVHEYLIGDAVRLRQIVINLLSNAVKYTPDGGTIRCDLEELPSQDEDHALLRLTVADNGYGMTPEFAARIFDPFTRAENSMTNKVQGTGLGMAITKSILDLMGGTITVESTVGQGSRFQVTLPILIDKEAKRRTPAVSEPREEGSVLRGMKFLCAEDNELNAEILEAILDMNGASCMIYPNGKTLVDAFAAVQPGDYDAILMDVQMPVMNGLDATRALRAGDNPLGRTIPIIAMTANAFSSDVQACLDAGMNAHLAKPIDIAALERTLKSILRTAGHAKEE